MEIADLTGLTFSKVELLPDDISEEPIGVRFETPTGRVFHLRHYQDCCEEVYLQNVCGDLQDLVGEPLTLAEEAISNQHPADYEPTGYEDSFTWTFYKFATRKGYVDLRFIGMSNGYYSEGVELYEQKPKPLVIGGEA